jgi:hypothetical protein
MAAARSAAASYAANRRHSWKRDSERDLAYEQAVRELNMDQMAASGVGRPRDEDEQSEAIDALEQELMAAVTTSQRSDKSTASRTGEYIRVPTDSKHDENTVIDISKPRKSRIEVMLETSTLMRLCMRLCMCVCVYVYVCV